MTIESGYTCRDVAEFHALLLRWLGELTETTVAGASGYKKGFLKVPIGGVMCELSGDSTRAGVLAYLVECELGAGTHLVVPNSKGTVNRVTPRSDGQTIPGFYLYTSIALPEATVLADDWITGEPEGRRQVAELLRHESPLLDLAEVSSAELFEVYAGILAELKARGIVRTSNPPAGDYAEWLVSRHLGVPLLVNSAKSWDLVSPAFGRVQVKARVVSDPALSGQLQAGLFSSDDFDHAALVLLAQADYSVERAALLPRSALESFWTPLKGGFRLMMTSAVFEHDDAVALTEALRVQAGRLE